MLERLRQHKLYAKRSKCEFAKRSIEFLGYFISDQGIQVDPYKVQAVMDWPILKNPHDIQCFMGLANYYRRFISKFAHKAAPLNKLLHKNIPWKWSLIEQKAFDALKNALILALVLALPDLNKPFTVFFNAASINTIGRILCQELNDEQLHLIAFKSR